MPRIELWLLEFDIFPKFDDPATFAILPDMFTSWNGSRLRAFVFFIVFKIVFFALKKRETEREIFQDERMREEGN